MPAPAIQLTSVTDAAQWDELIAAQHGHILQTFAWGELKSRFGWRAERWAWLDRSEYSSAAQILYRRLAPGVTVGYIPRGPTLATADSASEVQFLQALTERARSSGALMLKFEPNLHHADPRNNAFTQAHAVPSAETIQPPATILIDLTRNLEDILAGMKSKWRYNIRLAERKGVTVRAGTPRDLDAFFALMQLTGERDHFAIHGASYYAAAFDLLTANDHARLLIAEYGGSPLAMIFVTGFADEAIYLYGASGNTERNRMPNHALHWAAIQWAKARGCARYDLWGVPENAGEEDEDLPTSLYQFKQGFGGKVVHYTGAWDVIFNPALHALYKTARRLRKSAMV